MADLTFKQAFDADPAYGDTVKADDVLGLQAIGEAPGAQDKGISLQQIANGVRTYGFENVYLGFNQYLFTFSIDENYTTLVNWDGAQGGYTKGQHGDNLTIDETTGAITCNIAGTYIIVGTLNFNTNSLILDEVLELRTLHTGSFADTGAQVQGEVKEVSGSSYVTLNLSYAIALEPLDTIRLQYRRVTQTGSVAQNFLVGSFTASKIDP